MDKTMEIGDIFDDLFKESPEESDPGLKGLQKLIYRKKRSSNATTVKQNVNQQAPEDRSAKKKVTYYLSEKVLVELFDAKAKIKVMVPRNTKSRVSMSRIVDYAVNAILEEFKKELDKLI